MEHILKGMIKKWRSEHAYRKAYRSDVADELNY